MASYANHEPKGRIRISRKRLVGMALAAIAATIATVAWPPERFSDKFMLGVLSPFHLLEDSGYDALMAARGREEDRLDPRIVILGIDSDDEKNLGITWPFPRRVEAAVARNLARDGAQLVAFDVLFAGHTDPADDKALDAALKGPGNFVLTSRIVQGATGQQKIAMEPPYHADDPGGVDFEAHAASGFANIPDDNRIVRAMAPAETFQDQWIPSFPVAAYMKLNGIDPDKPGSIKVTDSAVLVGNLRIPRTGATANNLWYNTPIPTARIDYPAGAASFPMLADFSQVARGEESRTQFAGKFVFIGLTGAQLTKDRQESFVTAYSRFHSENFARDITENEVPGVIVQALHFNALLHGTFVRETTTLADWAIVFLVTLTAVGIVRRRPNLIGLLGVVGCAAGLFLFSLLCLKFRSLHVPWVIPNVLMLASAGGVGWLESGAIKRKWAGYVSPAVLDQILATEGGLEAKRFEAVVMFGDIRGFTSFSENHPPETVVFLLNRHLERLTEIITREHGTIDKFFGDGILAVFGAPIPLSDAARSAVRAAWLMREGATQPIVDEDGKSHVLATGFGIASGSFLGGDIGSRHLKNWTVIGDVVNLASRLQGVTGQPDVIIDSPTYHQVAEYAEVESLGEVTLKGKAQPVQCYRVTGWAEVPKVLSDRGQAAQLAATE